MINADIKEYFYSTIGEVDLYGQPQTSTEPKGTIKIAIYTSSQSITDNIKYKDCSYIGLTHDKTINDSFVIHYGEAKLKVLYVNSMGRYTQAFLKEI